MSPTWISNSISKATFNFDTPLHSYYKIVPSITSLELKKNVVTIVSLNLFENNNKYSFSLYHELHVKNLKIISNLNRSRLKKN